MLCNVIGVTLTNGGDLIVFTLPIFTFPMMAGQCTCHKNPKLSSAGGKGRVLSNLSKVCVRYNFHFSFNVSQSVYIPYITFVSILKL
jgi:hypothetical protein